VNSSSSFIICHTISFVGSETQLQSPCIVIRTVSANGKDGEGVHWRRLIQLNSLRRLSLLVLCSQLCKLIYSFVSFSSL